MTRTELTITVVAFLSAMTGFLLWASGGDLVTGNASFDGQELVTEQWKAVCARDGIGCEYVKETNRCDD